MEGANNTFSQEWLKKMEDRARKCRQEDGGPDVTVGFYAARKVRGKWKISNGRTWWDNPQLVREFHEYDDGTVVAHSYIEGVQMFGRRNIEAAGLRAVRPSEVANVLPISKYVYFDHRVLDDRGRAQRLVYEVPQDQKEAAK